MSKPTKYAIMLYKALRKRGIKCKLEVPDGFKHVDISVEWADLDIEVDGKYHLTNPFQRKRDFKRMFWSAQDGYSTFRVSNEEIKFHLNEIADEIAEIARQKYYRNKSYRRYFF